MFNIGVLPSVCVCVCVRTQGLGMTSGAADGSSWTVTCVATAPRAQPRFHQEFPLTFIVEWWVEGGLGWRKTVLGLVQQLAGQPPPRSLSEVGAGDRPSPSPPSPLPSSKASSSSSLSSLVLGPGLALWPKVWTLRNLGSPAPARWNPDPGRRQTFPPPLLWPRAGIYFGPVIKEPHQCAQAGISGVSGSGAHGEGPRWFSSGSGGRFQKA